jgi:hypothetical protein
MCTPPSLVHLKPTFPEGGISSFDYSFNQQQQCWHCQTTKSEFMLSIWGVKVSTRREHRIVQIIYLKYEALWSVVLPRGNADEDCLK